MPGNKAFINRAAQHLRDGRNVILNVPAETPTGLEACLQEICTNDIGSNWVALEAPEANCCQRPAEWLLDQIDGHVGTDEIINATCLANHCEFQGRLVWLRGVPGALWPAWHSFLADYAHALRNVNLINRTVLCVCRAGTDAILPAPVDDVCLATIDLNGMSDLLDMRLYVATKLDREFISTIYRNLAIELIVVLACWDSELADLLCDQELSILLNPIKLLKTWGEERGWHQLDRASVKWTSKAIGRFEDRDEPHSAFCVCQGMHEEVKHRLWKAQLAVLFPYIEMRRLEIIEKHKTKFTLPYPTRHDDITNVYDLEIGHICEQFKRMAGISLKLQRTVEMYRHIRNALAHGNVVEPQWLHEAVL